MLEVRLAESAIEPGKGRPQEGAEDSEDKRVTTPQEVEAFQRAVMKCVQFTHRVHDYGIGVVQGEQIAGKGIADLIVEGTALWREVIRMSPTIRERLGSEISFDDGGNISGGHSA